VELFHVSRKLTLADEASQYPSGPKVSGSIRFLLNDRVVELNDLSPTTSVLTFLRQHTGRCGTKEGCAEGDCGACTVVIGELCNGDLQMKAVNACIQFLPTLDGKALYTVEGLRQADGRLHPVQEAMVASHGSQCGFCTPGFVMSLWALYLDVTSGWCDEARVRQAITGNLCRCTGYRPIIEAGLRMFELPRAPFDRDALKKSLAAISRHDATNSLRYEHAGHHFHAPRTLVDLFKLRRERPNATILAGGTDIGLWVNKQLRDLGDIIYVGEVAELRAIQESPDTVTIGAGVSLNDAYTALKTHYPQMNQMWERFASVPIRNAGTLGGNIANGSPIGDTMPPLIALGATVTLASVTGMRTLALEDLYLGYQKKALSPDEIVLSVTIPKPGNTQAFRVYKLAKRFDSDISAVCAAFAIWRDGEMVTKCRIAYGGMAETPKRAVCAEAVIIGQTWDEPTVSTAMDALASDFTPLTDMRASAGYRITACRNLLYRFFLETRADAPLGEHAVNVFSSA
jgi:xanthine dehydrogenase small subunit